MAPALTPDEWRDQIANCTKGDPRVSHAVAALALHGQPFGFTRADVSELRAAAKRALERSVDEVGAFAETDWTMLNTSNRLHALADRIAALLPPEGA